MSEKSVTIGNSVWNKNTAEEIRDKITELGLYPSQYAGLVLDAMKNGLVELTDDIIIEYDADAGRAKVTITFERGTVGTIEYYLNVRELKKILNGLDDIAACET
jgi:hypothetical protein